MQCVKRFQNFGYRPVPQRYQQRADTLWGFLRKIFKEAGIRVKNWNICFGREWKSVAFINFLKGIQKYKELGTTGFQDSSSRVQVRGRAFW